MAQTGRRPGTRASRLLGRLGLAGRGRVVAALAAILAGATALCLARAAAVPAEVVERDEPAATSDAARDPGETREAGEASEGERVVVHVDGAVAVPGVYRLEGDDLRVQDAVDAAGGLSAEADTAQTNLAAPLEDGSKVHVPAAGEAGAQAGPAAEAAGGGAPELVNINTASEAELDELPGVGPATAAAIVEEREANGPFASPEDIMRVSGIAEKRFAKLEDLICV